MHERRIYVPPSRLTGNSLQLDGSEAHYLLRVLRLRQGDSVTAFDGEGRARRAAVTVAGRDFAILRLGERSTATKRTRRFAVAQALLKPRAMETVMQKCTELGADALIGFHAERSVTRGDDDRVLARWWRIATEACRQCRRDFVPRIDFLQSVESLASQFDSYDRVIAASLSKGGETLHELLTSNPPSKTFSLLLVIGPEGDFTQQELERLCARGAIACRLSDAVLRAETAAIAAAAVTAQHLLSPPTGSAAGQSS